MACKLLDSPFQGVVLRHVGSVACRGVELRTLDVFRHRDKDIDVVSNASLFVVAFDFYNEFYFGVGWGFNNHIN